MAGFDWLRIRILAVGGLIALAPLAVIISWAVTPIWHSITEAESDKMSIQEYRKLAAEKPLYRAELAKAEADLAQSGMLYNNASPELASAQLQSNLQGLVAQSGGQIQSTAIGTPQTGHGLEILTVTVSLSLPPAQLSAFLTSIEAWKPYLLVQGIDIRSADFGNQTDPLDIQLQVNGFSNIQ